MLAWLIKATAGELWCGWVMVVSVCYNAMYQVGTVLLIREALTMIKCTLPDQQLMW